MAGISTGLASRLNFDGSNAISDAYGRELQAIITAANRRSNEQSDRLRAKAIAGAAAAAASGRPSRKAFHSGVDPYAEQRQQREAEIEQRQKWEEEQNKKARQSQLEQQWIRQNEKILEAAQRRIDAGFDFNPRQKQDLELLNKEDERINEAVGRGVMTRNQGLQAKMDILQRRAALVPQTRNQQDPVLMEKDRQFKEEQKRDGMKFRKDLQEEGMDFKLAGEAVEAQFGFNPHKTADGKDIPEPSNWRTANKGLTAAQQLDAFTKIRKQISDEELNRKDDAEAKKETYTPLTPEQIDAKARDTLNRNLRAIGILPPNAAGDDGASVPKIAAPMAGGPKKRETLEDMMLSDEGMRTHFLTEPPLSPKEIRKVLGGAAGAPSLGFGPSLPQEDPYPAYARARAKVLAETPIVTDPKQLEELPAGASFRAKAPDGSIRVMRNKPKTGGPVDRIVQDPTKQEALVSPQPLSRTEYLQKYGGDRDPLAVADEYQSYLKAREAVAKAAITPAVPQPGQLPGQGRMEPIPLGEPNPQPPQPIGVARPGDNQMMPLIQPAGGPAQIRDIAQPPLPAIPAAGQLPQIIPGRAIGNPNEIGGRMGERRLQVAIDDNPQLRPENMEANVRAANERAEQSRKVQSGLANEAASSPSSEPTPQRKSEPTPQKPWQPSGIQKLMLTDPKFEEFFKNPAPASSAMPAPFRNHPEEFYRPAMEAREMWRKGFRMPEVAPQPPSSAQPQPMPSGNGMSNRGTGGGLSGASGFLRDVEAARQAEFELTANAKAVQDRKRLAQEITKTMNSPIITRNNGSIVSTSYYNPVNQTWSNSSSAGPRMAEQMLAMGVNPLGGRSGGGGGGASAPQGSRRSPMPPPLDPTSSAPSFTGGFQANQPPPFVPGDLDMSGGYGGYEEPFSGNPASGIGPTDFSDSPGPFPEGMSAPEDNYYPPFFGDPGYSNPSEGFYPAGDYDYGGYDYSV